MTLQVTITVVGCLLSALLTLVLLFLRGIARQQVEIAAKQDLILTEFHRVDLRVGKLEEWRLEVERRLRDGDREHARVWSWIAGSRHRASDQKARDES